MSSTSSSGEPAVSSRDDAFSDGGGGGLLSFLSGSENWVTGLSAFSCLQEQGKPSLPGEL